MPTHEPLKRPPNRRDRRAYQALRRRQDKAEQNHRCAVAVSARAEGVEPDHDFGVGILFFHDLHRALSEVSCPKCPECIALKREGKLDRAGPRLPKHKVLADWHELLVARRAQDAQDRQDS